MMTVFYLHMTVTHLRCITIGFQLNAFYRWLIIVYVYQHGQPRIRLNYSIVTSKNILITPKCNHNLINSIMLVLVIVAITCNSLAYLTNSGHIKSTTTTKLKTIIAASTMCGVDDGFDISQRLLHDIFGLSFQVTQQSYWIFVKNGKIHVQQQKQISKDNNKMVILMQLIKFVFVLILMQKNWKKTCFIRCTRYYSAIVDRYPLYLSRVGRNKYWIKTMADIIKWKLL